jgi:hypothetical protein
MDTLICYNDRDFTINATGESAPQFGIFRSILGRVVDWQMAETSALNDYRLYTR